MKAHQRLLTALLLSAIGGLMGAVADNSGEVRPAAPQRVSLRLEGELPALDGAIGWLNSAALTAASLRGKVVLIEFWTYTCINWRRTLPYVRAWSLKYKDQGLVVIGVHTPEFEFEKQLDNVRQATGEMRIEYPVAVDSNYAIWRAFRNEYWPALYFIDAQGRIRHHQFGEGDYAQSERVLQELLTEARGAAVSGDLVSVDAGGFEAAAEKDAIVLNVADGRIAYRFHARDLHLIMAPGTRGASVRFRVFLDGRPPGAAHGLDIDEQGNGTVSEPRMYQLIRQQEPIADRQFEIEFLDQGVEAFDFSFG
jgi:thiol-disulfide isomerase/thioredoxin